MHAKTYFSQKGGPVNIVHMRYNFVVVVVELDFNASVNQSLTTGAPTWIRRSWIRVLHSSTHTSVSQDGVYIRFARVALKWQMPHVMHWLFSDLVSYTETAKGCLADDYQPAISGNYYVEITLSGCKYLCENLHDLTCTLIVYLPSLRSCFLQPLQMVTFERSGQGCTAAELHHRNRQTGQSPGGCIIRSWSAYHRSFHVVRAWCVHGDPSAV